MAPQPSPAASARRSMYHAPPARLSSPALVNERSRSPANKAVLAPLRQTRMVNSKPVLPAELLEMVIDYLPIADLMRVARVSKRQQEMVYDDTRWVQKLNLMGLWNEAEARKRFEEMTRRKREGQSKGPEDDVRRTGSVNGHAVNGGGRPVTTMFDQGIEERRQQQRTESKRKSLEQQASLASGFDAISLGPASQHGPAPTHVRSSSNPKAALDILKTVRSIRGGARQEYGRLYGALAPFYLDLARARSHTDPIVFKTYRDPEEQAQMLSQLRVFCRSDNAQGWQERQEALDSMIGIFENAVLREFEQGYSMNDIDGRMKRYAHVLVKLNGGAAGIDYYIHNHPLMLGTLRLDANPESLTHLSPEGLSLRPSEEFFQKLLDLLNEESGKIDIIFPDSVDVLIPFLDRIGEDVVAEYVTPLFDEAHKGNLETYLQIVAGVFEQSVQFVRSIRPTKGASEDFLPRAAEIMNRVFEPHIDLFLEEELDFFKRTATKDVDDWEQRLREHESSQETFYMSNVTRAAAKQDFLTSFKKVLLMPVNAIETSFSGGSKASTQAHQTDLNTVDTSYNSSFRAPSPHTHARSISPGSKEAPTTELAAKAAIMNSKLEGIGTLFSLEVALNLVHRAKASLERAASFVRLGGHSGEEAKEQCEAIFVHLIQVLGFRHIKPGFDKAVSHLSTYNAREAVEHGQSGGVKPLVTFLELVNVGDLIQQMVDAFYIQELVSPKLTDRDDFLNPTVKEKKRFEQMLDERVAAGLNHGIDVLMDEVEFVCATTQQPTDYNPAATSAVDKRSTLPSTVDIGPTPTARRVVDLVSSHTSMLTGTADKNTLDVFNTEVGSRLFSALTKHLKRQRISTAGAITLISDTNMYFSYVQTLKNRELLRYFRALREVAQIFLVDGSDAKEIATLIADQERFQGVMPTEEVLEFAQRRADWYNIRRQVEGAMYGMGCTVM